MLLDAIRPEMTLGAGQRRRTHLDHRGRRDPDRKLTRTTVHEISVTPPNRVRTSAFGQAGTSVAPLDLMKSLSRFFRKRREAPRTLDVDEVARHSGIADVDPQPMTQIAGEGIDPDDNEKARTSVKEQRDRLPTSRGR